MFTFGSDIFGCRGEAGEGLAAPFPGPGREPGGGAPRVVGLAGVVGGEDALVADGEQAGDPQGERGQARQAAPAAGDAGGGGILDGGCDTRSHVVSELGEEVWLMPGT